MQTRESPARRGFFVLAVTLLAACAQPEPAPQAAGGKVTLPGGIMFEPRVAGSGESPKASDTVRVHYRGTLPDGREFDSSYKTGQPAEFPLNRVIRCWTEGVQLMRPGGKARLTCPPATAYGERGAGGVIPPNATLIFDIELLSVTR
jgi:FKBP-type peptidyl-prolyl cis-trans isomerase FkpA